MEKSTILNEGEVNNIITPPAEGEVSTPAELPSEKNTTNTNLPSEEGKKAEGAEANEVKETKEGAEPKETKEPKDEDLGAYFNEYTEKGELSEDSYAKLKEKGYTKEYVDDQIEFYEYKKNKAVKGILEPFGGQEAFNKAAEWAQTNMTQEQIDGTNKRLSSGNKETINDALKELMSAYNKGTEKAPAITLHSNSNFRGNTPTGYASKESYVKDALDPRYDSDKAYREKVEAKFLATDQASWYR